MQKLAGILLGASVLAGCSTPEQTSSLECAGGAAAVSMAICKLAGGSNQSCLIATAGASGLAGAICYNYAKNLVKQQEQLTGHEQDLDARIHYIQVVNSDTEKLNQQLQARLVKLNGKTDELAAQVRRGELSGQELARARQESDNEVKAAKQQVAAAEDQLRYFKRLRAEHPVQPSSKLATENAEVAKFEKLLANARASTTAMASTRQRL